MVSSDLEVVVVLRDNLEILGLWGLQEVKGFKEIRV